MNVKEIACVQTRQKLGCFRYILKQAADEFNNIELVITNTIIDEINNLKFEKIEEAIIKKIYSPKIN